MKQLPTLSQLLKHAIEGRLLDVHTAMIAKVESYDAATQLVNVVPVLKKSIETLDGDVKSEHLPVLCDVPLLFPRAGGFFISLPIQPGDFVQLLFNETDIEEWFEDKVPTIIHDQRFTLQGAVAIPGIFPRAKALLGTHKSNLVIGKEQGLQLHVDDQKIRLGSADATEALALASKVREELDRIKDAFHKHTHAPAGGNIKPTDRIVMSSDIAAQYVVAQ